jgi:predicted Zn-dependent protease
MLIINELEEICQLYPDLKLEFKYEEWETDFLRFYQSQTNYNLSKNSPALHTVIHKGKKSYSFKLYAPTKQSIIEKIDNALSFIDSFSEDPHFDDIEDNLEKSEAKSPVDNIRNLPLASKINILQEISNAIAHHNFKIYGTFISNYVKTFYVNSNGVNKEEIVSPIMLEVKAMSDDNQVTVLETFGGDDLSTFDLDHFIENLHRKIKTAQQEIIDIEPGHYTAILSPRCIGEFLVYLSYSMRAKVLDAHESFFEDQLNKQVFPKNITIYDDPTHPDLIGYKYNEDGHIYKKTALIENGIFRNFMVDNYYGRKLNMKKNGATGKCLIMDTGKTKLDKMISSVKKGIFISSLHYMNFINHKETSVTGLTRDGTFLIENGKLTKVINNLRFTDKIADIIDNISEIENRSYTIPFSSNYGNFSIVSAKMPHVKTKDIFISSSTETI